MEKHNPIGFSSTTLAAKPDGALHSKQLYKPFGEARYTSGSLPTAYQFTGQRQEAELGLYYRGFCAPERSERSKACACTTPPWGASSRRTRSCRSRAIHIYP